MNKEQTPPNWKNLCGALTRFHSPEEMNELFEGYIQNSLQDGDISRTIADLRRSMPYQYKLIAGEVFSRYSISYIRIPEITLCPIYSESTLYIKLQKPIEGIVHTIQALPTPHLVSEPIDPSIDTLLITSPNTIFVFENTGSSVQYFGLYSRDEAFNNPEHLQIFESLRETG